MKYRNKRFGVTLCAVLLIAALLAVIPLAWTDAADGGRSSGVLAAEAQATAQGPVYVIPVQQTIETGLYKFLVRAFREATSNGARHIILEVNTLGGRVDAAEDIGELISSSPIPTVAYVQGKAASAGSYIAMNANQIVMAGGSTIGSAAVVDITGARVEDSKTISFWLGEMRAAAELRNRNPLIAEGMVLDELVVELPEIGRTFGAGELVNLTANEALAVGYAEHVASSRQEVLAFIGAEGAEVREIHLSAAEKLARLLTNPIVMTILVIIGIGGIVTEIFIPGFGVPGLIGIGAFSLYFFGSYVAGFAGVEAIFLFVAGIVLMAIEVVFPGFGIFGLLGIISMVGGVVMAAYDTGSGLKTIGIALLVDVVLVAIIVKLFKHRGVWNKFVLREELTTDQGFISQTSKQHLLGKTGLTVTPLRPAGVAEIEGERVDVVTSGEFISIRQPIIVKSIEGTRVVVREHKQ